MRIVRPCTEQPLALGAQIPAAFYKAILQGCAVSPGLLGDLLFRWIQTQILPPRAVMLGQHPGLGWMQKHFPLQ